MLINAGVVGSPVCKKARLSSSRFPLSFGSGANSEPMTMGIDRPANAPLPPLEPLGVPAPGYLPPLPGLADDDVTMMTGIASDVVVSATPPMFYDSMEELAS